MNRVPLRAALALAGLLMLCACSGTAPEGTSAARPAPVTAASAASAASAVSGAPAASGTASATSPAPPATSGSAAASSTAGAREAADADPTRLLRREIERLVGTAACRDDSQCRALPLGSKPCGGPEGYVAWSTAQTDERELEALAQRYKSARQARNRQLGLISDCAVLPEPVVRCVSTSSSGGSSPSRRCEASSGRVGGPPALSTR